MRPEQLHRLVILAEIADAGSVSEAARRLGVGKSSVSHHVAELEREAGARVLDRVGRGVRLTPLGEEMAAHGRTIAREGRAALAAAREAEQPRGSLRVAMPAGIADALVIPMLARFLDRYPGIRLDVSAADRVVDIAAEGIDVAFRIGGVADGAFVARPLFRGIDIFVASPAYLSAAPEIARPADVPLHPWIGFRAFGEQQSLTVEGEDGSAAEILVAARVLTTSGLSIRHWALAGAGLARIPAFTVADELADGRLVRVLPGHVCGRPVLHAAYMPERFRPANVKRLVDFAREYFSPERT